MKKGLRKILAFIVSLTLLATFCAVPMSVSATPPEGETYEDYDVIYYSDLLSGGNHLPADGYEITETNNPFTYAATSDTHSAIYKFRYVAGVYIYFQIFPGEYRSGNPFSCRLANATTWERRYDPDQGTMPVGYTVAEGDIIDFEVARLKVATGDNVGKYYTYMKANGTMIYETYVESSYINEEKDLKNGIQLNFSKSDGRYCYIQPLPDTYADYDIVTYSDLLDTGNNHLSSGGITSNSKNEIYHYTATSATHSVIYRFRYVVGTCTYFQMYPGEYCTDPFMYRIEPGASANYVKRYSPGNSTISAGTSISSGDELDIEIGRLMVATGDNAGKYYSYFKVNGELKFEVYVATGDITDLKALEDSIQFALNSGNCGFGIKPIPDVLDDYDEVYYEDLIDTGNNHLTAGGVTLTSQNNLYHYTATSESHSAIYKFRWVAGNDIYFQMHPGTYGSTNNFAYRINGTNFNQRNPDQNQAIGYTINEGDELDLEVARLFVADGGHAGMYYTYFKVDDDIIFEKYVYANDANTTGYLADQVQLCLRDGNDRNCGIKPIPETYEEYDDIGYRDLTTINDGGSTAAANPDGWTLSNTGKYCEYAGTSATKSAIFKFRWTIGDLTKMSICFDRKGSSGHALEYMFGAIIEDGKINFRPESGGAKTDIPAELLATLTEGSSHDVEFARLKVANGRNIGKYYIYMKIDGQTIAEGYVAANVVDANGDYTSAPSSSACSLAYMITFNFYGSNGNVISAIPVPDTYADYDEIGYSDLTTINDGGSTAAANPDGWTLSNTGKYCEYAGTSATKSAIFKFRWTIGDLTKMSICFDRKGSSGHALEYMFGAIIEDGKINFRPESGGAKTDISAELLATLTEGSKHNVEFARLKVASGDNAGKYYVYLKIDEVTLAEGYVAANVVDANGDYTSAPSSSACSLAYMITFNFYGSNGNVISAIPVPSLYEEYDEVGYADLTTINDGGSTAAANPDGWTLSNTGKYCEYAGTSTTKSAIFKFRWTIGDATKMSICFDRKGSSGHALEYMFGAIIEDGKINFRPESGGAKTDIPAELLATLTEGSSHNVEFARLKVASGDNAGKYYMYLNIDGETLAEGYVAANVVDANGDYTSAPSSSACSLAYMITFNFYGSNGNVISAIYDTPDQIGYHDLLINGNPLPSRKSALNGKNIFTYERTSDSYSAVFKYRWIAGNPAKFSLSFDTNNTEGTGDESFPFCAVAKYPNQSGYGATAGANGAWQIDPSVGANIVQMSTPLTVGGSYDIEFGRLKAIGSSASLKYYVYLKVNDTLIKSYFYTVNADGTYKSTCLSNNIVFTVYDSTGNRITADGADNILEHEGTRGDFDNNGNISFVDFATLRDVVLGIVNINDLPAGIADIDNNTDVDIFDYVSLKNYFIQPEGYTKSGSLAIGTQEHLLEDETKTAAYIADATATLGATAYRLSMPIHNLYSVTKTNGVEENVTNMNKLKEQVEQLKAQGINTILYVTDSFILPYNYYNSSYCHHKTVPNPDTDTDNYIAWLTVNSLAFGALAEAVPEIKFFEPFNEINLKSIRLEKYGVNWSASESAQTNYKYTVSEKAGIMADLCWYISREVKAVDRKNQVTTPSICVGSHIGSNLEGTFLSALYSAIESGDYPIDSAVGDKRIDNYFTIVNIHAYPEYSTGTTQQTTKVNNLASDINSTYNTMLSHGDGASRVWITETGVSSYDSNNWRNEDEMASLLERFFNKVNNNLTFVDTVITYKIADMSTSGSTDVESAYGLFYAGDASSNPYGAKKTAKAIYKFCNNGSTDYSALTSLAARYAS